MTINNATSQFRINYKVIIFLVLFIIGLYLIIPKLIDVQEAIKLIIKVNKFYLILAIGCEFISYIGAATLLGIILQRLGYRVAFWDRFRIGSIAAFAIHFFPVGTFGGGAIDFYFLRRKNVEAGSILLMFVLRMLISYAAFLTIFIVGLLLVPMYPQLPFSPRIISFILFAVVVWGILYIIHLYRRKEKFRQIWLKYLNFINFLLQKVKKEPYSRKKILEVFEDIYRGIGIFGGKKRISVFALLAGLTYWLGDIICFYFVFLSFGYKIHFGVLLFGYGAATLAGLVSFVPGGLGITEGSMGLVFSGLGVPLSLALMSILVFRFFSFWIWIPIGLLSFYTLRRGFKSSR